MANPSQSSQSTMRVFVLNRRTVLSLFLLICVVCLITSNQFWRWMYPIAYQPIIQTASDEAQVDPLLVASVIRVESKFRSSDVSHAGAVGLMQLMPNTAEWLANQMAEAGVQAGYSTKTGAASLAQPEVNIRIGSWYIHYLEQKFNGNQVAAVAAYNAGPMRVQQWLASGTWDGQLRTIGNIPVGETRHFVDRVFYNYDLYKRIYGDEFTRRTST